MNFGAHRNVLGVRVLLAGSSMAALMAASGPAMAQAQSAAGASATAADSGGGAPPSAVNEIVVTGSRIRGTVAVGSAVIGLSREDIVSSTAITTTQMLQEVPQVANLGVSETSRGQAGGSANITYSSGINLRGIGPYATLTLLDGHRAVGQGTGGQLFDPSAIPTIALQRLEVVADGASAIYGSDAIAGVVNLILRRNYNGAEVSLHYGGGDHYDERQLSAVLGRTWDTGGFMIAYENGFHSNLSGRNRDFYSSNLTAKGGGDTRVTQCSPGNITLSGVSYAIPAGGVTASNAGSLVAGTTNKCDLIKNADLLPMQNHNSAAFTFNQELGPVVSLFADGFVLRRDFTFHGGPVSGNLTVPSSNAFFVAPGGAHPASETVGYAFTNDFGLNNDSFGYSVAYEATIGADVKLPHDWKFEGDYTYGRDDDRSTAYNLNNAGLNAALASSNPATAFNPFGGANSAAVLANVKNSAFIAPGRTTQQEFEGKFDGPVMTIPGGDVRVAIGGEYLREDIWSGLNSGPPTALTAYRIPASRDVRSGYIEAFVPLVGAANAMPGIQRLDVDLAGRYESYSDQGTTSNPKFGVNWSPAHGWLFRGSYGTSFRAPLLAQTHPASTALYVQNYSDPTSPTGVTQGLTLSGASPNLKPETAKTYSAGVEYQPDFLPRAKFTLTYFDIDYENQITSYLSDLTLLQRESYFSQIITRNPNPAYISTLTSKYVVNGVLPSPLLLFVNGQSLNLGKSVTRGLDFQAAYHLPAMSWGDVTLGLNGTYLTTYDVAVTASAPLLTQLNTIFNPLQFRTRGSAAWRKDGWDGVLFVNYTNGYKNNRVTPVQNVDGFATVDLNLGYTFGDKVLGGWAKGVKVSVDARNLFDAKPPFVNIAPSPNGGGGFDPTAADPVGRVIGITLDKKW